MTGDNPLSADNQQERPGIEQWIVGFVDGEGCFSVPIFKNSTSSAGWQVQPQFSVVQGARSVHVLHELERFFECGSVVRNGRHDNHREDVYRFGVRRLTDLSKRIVPFFEANPLRTAKRDDFLVFAQIVDRMSRRDHRTVAGLESIAKLTETMNRRKRSRFLESSETTRQPSRIDVSR